MTQQEIMEKYGVSRTTAWYSKKRGWLWFKYHERGEHATKVQQDRFLEIISDKRLKHSFLSIPTWKITEIRNGSTSLSKSDWLGFKTEITRVRNVLRKFLDYPTNKNYQKIITTSLVANKYLLDARLYDRSRKGYDIESEKLESEKIEIAAFYNFLRV